MLFGGCLWETASRPKTAAYLARDEFHAARERGLGRAVLAHALVGGRDAAHAAARVAEQLRVKECGTDGGNNEKAGRNDERPVTNEIREKTDLLKLSVGQVKDATCDKRLVLKRPPAS